MQKKFKPFCISAWGRYNLYFKYEVDEEIRKRVFVFFVFFCFVLLFSWCADNLTDYHLGHVIGRGGFGQVISATRKTDNLPVSTGKKKSYMANKSSTWLENF